MKKKIVEWKDGQDVCMGVLVNGAYVTVDIRLINEYNAFGSNRKRYRVDFRGRTVLSLSTLTECKAKARQVLEAYR